jgi:hypothetical protein
VKKENLYEIRGDHGDFATEHYGRNYQAGLLNALLQSLFLVKHTSM